MKKLLLILSVISTGFISSCDDEPGNTNISLDFNIYLKNSDGKNLFDPNADGYYISDSIRLYRFKDGEMTEIYHPNLALQRNFRIVKATNGEYFMNVVADEGEGNESQTTLTLIQWDKNNFDNIDTVETVISKKYIKGNTSISVDRITYNSVVRWDVTNYPLYIQWGNDLYKRLIEVVK